MPRMRHACCAIVVMTTQTFCSAMASVAEHATHTARVSPPYQKTTGTALNARGWEQVEGEGALGCQQRCHQHQHQHQQRRNSVQEGVVYG
jgi:hypothetical protein